MCSTTAQMKLYVFDLVLGRAWEFALCMCELTGQSVPHFNESWHWARGLLTSCFSPSHTFLITSSHSITVFALVWIVISGCEVCDVGMCQCAITASAGPELWQSSTSRIFRLKTFTCSVKKNGCRATRGSQWKWIGNAAFLKTPSRLNDQFHPLSGCAAVFNVTIVSCFSTLPILQYALNKK